MDSSLKPTTIPEKKSYLTPEDNLRIDMLYERLYRDYRPRECFLFLVKSALDHYEKTQKEAYRK